MITSFEKDWADPPSLHLSGNEFQRVKITNCLCFTFSNDLSWSEHVSNIYKEILLFNFTPNSKIRSMQR